MEIQLSQFAGFCDGVKRAYDMVCSLDMKKSKKPVFILGSLVHNPDVNRKIEEKGIKSIGREFFFQAKSGEIGTVIITAHGTGPDVYAQAKKIGADILDTTCPKVIKVQRLARLFAKKGCQIVIVGDKNHKEVRGINDWGEKKAKIVSAESDLESLEFSPERAISVISQTTQSEDFFEKVGNFIKNKYPQTEIISTVCLTTHERQEEIKKLASQADAVVVIGSAMSANSNRLFEIAKKINSKTYFIENARELKPEWFRGVSKTVVTAGASAPGWIIQEIISRLGCL